MVKSTLLLEINTVVKSSNSSLMTAEFGQYENQRVSAFSVSLFRKFSVGSSSLDVKTKAYHFKNKKFTITVNKWKSTPNWKSTRTFRWTSKIEGDKAEIHCSYTQLFRYWLLCCNARDNWAFPSCFSTLCPNESSYHSFENELRVQVPFHANWTCFHKKGFARRLAIALN